MGRALEIIAGQVTAPSTTLTALTMHSGNSATVRSARADSDIRMISAWANNQAAGILQVRSPLMHDNVRGFRAPVSASVPEDLIPRGVGQRLFPNDALTLELSGSATAGDIEQAAFLILYEDLPGITGQFLSPEEVLARGVNILTVYQTLATGTAGGWSGEEALNAETSLLKSGKQYALLGGVVDTDCLAVRYVGSDWGNVGVGFPGRANDPHHTKGFFLDLSWDYGLPLVPIITADNIGSINVAASQDENGTDVIVGTILVELAPG